MTLITIANTCYAAASVALQRRGRDPVYCVWLIIHDASLRRWYETYHGVADEMRELDEAVQQMFALEEREPVQMRLEV